MYDRQPHGLVGKGYRALIVCSLFILGSIVMSAVGVAIFAAPFWIIGGICIVLALAFFGFVALLTQVQGGEG